MKNLFLAVQGQFIDFYFSCFDNIDPIALVPILENDFCAVECQADGNTGKDLQLTFRQA
jgi:hypothetical protein